MTARGRKKISFSEGPHDDHTEIQFLSEREYDLKNLTLDRVVRNLDYLYAAGSHDAS
jgi:hypothetical protein